MVNFLASDFQRAPIPLFSQSNLFLNSILDAMLARLGLYPPNLNHAEPGLISKNGVVIITNSYL
jgi:hypothetical protein